MSTTRKGTIQALRVRTARPPRARRQRARIARRDAPELRHDVRARAWRAAVAWPCPQAATLRSSTVQVAVRPFGVGKHSEDDAATDGHRSASVSARPVAARGPTSPRASAVVRWSRDGSRGFRAASIAGPAIRPSAVGIARPRGRHATRGDRDEDEDKSGMSRNLYGVGWITLISCGKRGEWQPTTDDSRHRPHRSAIDWTSPILEPRNDASRTSRDSRRRRASGARLHRLDARRARPHRPFDRLGFLLTHVLHRRRGSQPARRRMAGRHRTPGRTSP